MGIKKERKIVWLHDLIEKEIGDRSIEDYEVISVLNSKGEVMSKDQELEIVYEVEWDDGVDESELTPDEQNDELRSLGF